MSPEELDKAKWAEAYDRAQRAYPGGCTISWKEYASDFYRQMTVEYRQMTVENWTPPPVSPRVKAAREALKGIYAASGLHATDTAQTIDRGEYDYFDEAQGFLAGVAWAVEKAGPLDSAAQDAARFYQEEGWDYRECLQRLFRTLATYRQEIGDGQ